MRHPARQVNLLTRLIRPEARHDDLAKGPYVPSRPADRPIMVAERRIPRLPATLLPGRKRLRLLEHRALHLIESWCAPAFRLAHCGARIPLPNPLEVDAGEGGVKRNGGVGNVIR